jgi:glycosyltransferase involved in cell wall biosynthesis
MSEQGANGAVERRPTVRIFFDVYELAPGVGKSIGVYNYARHLLHAVASSERVGVQLVVACNRAALADFSPPPGCVSIEHLVLGDQAPPLAKRLHWIYFGAAQAVRRTRADVYFSPRGFLPYLLRVLKPGVRSVVTIHDLIRLWYREHFPGHFNWLEDQFICYELMRSARRADRLIAISNTSAEDIAARIGPRGGVCIAYNGVAVAEAPSEPPRTGYLFAISSELPHKNKDRLLAGYARYRNSSARPLQLVVCGIPDPCMEGVSVVKNLSDLELSNYYSGAQGFLFLSLVEGFGFPPLEAMSHGVPVLCSDIAVFRELLGGDAEYVDPASIESIAAGIAKFENTRFDVSTEAGDPKLGRRARAATYSWDRCARRTLDVLLQWGTP